MGETVTASPILGGVVTTLVDAATIAWPFGGAFAYAVTPTANRLVGNPTNIVPGTILTLMVTQGLGGGHLLTYDTNFRFAGGVPPVLSTAAGAVDVLQFYTNGTLMYLMSVTLNIAAYLLPPSNLTASTDETAQITLNWVNHATNATGVRVQKFDGIEWQDLVDLAVVTTYVDGPLDPGLYQYRVRAIDAVHASDPSNAPVGEAL